MPGSRIVLITSRDRLTGLTGAQPLQVEVLTEPEAIDLFTGLVGADRCPDPAELAQVVGLVGYLPLAVEMVAGRMPRTRR